MINCKCLGVDKVKSVLRHQNVIFQGLQVFTCKSFLLCFGRILIRMCAPVHLYAWCEVVSHAHYVFGGVSSCREEEKMT